MALERATLVERSSASRAPLAAAAAQRQRRDRIDAKHSLLLGVFTESGMADWR